MSFHFEEGEVFLIDKPIGWTSFDTVNLIRAVIKRFHKIKKIKVGHAGTLDPLATGLLIICTGKMTKKIDEFQAQEKVYSGTMLLGQTTPTYDLESEPNQRFSTENINAEAMEAARQLFLGDIMQTPPKFSAIKIEGKRAYEFARSDEEVAMKARQIHIADFQLDATRFPEVDFVVGCSKGTYIRSLINDYGKALNNGACLIALRREKIGDFDVKDAWNLEDLRSKIIETAEQNNENEN